jgi:hypothetical protein
MDLIASNNVLEYELKMADQQITQHKVKKGSVPDDLMDKKQQIEIKMQLLVLQVQSGKLTMEGERDANSLLIDFDLI